MRFETYDVGNVPADVLEFWKTRRAMQDPFSVFTGGYDWYRMLAGEDPGESTVGVARSDGGDVQMILPLQARPWKVGLIRWPGASPIGPTIRTLKVAAGDVVDDATTARNLFEGDLWKQWFERFPDTDAFWLGHVTGAERVDMISRPLRRGGAGAFVSEIFHDLPHYRLVLPPTLDELWARRSRSSIKKIFGRERALAKETGKTVRLLEVRTKEQMAPYRDAIITLMRTTWQARWLHHRFDMGGADQLADWGFLRSFVLLVGEDVAAYAHGYYGEGVWVYAEIGFDERYAAHSPGTILLYRILEYFYQQNADRPRCVDFGEGDADYKRQLATECRAVSSLMVVRDRVRLRCLLRMMSVSNGVFRWLQKSAGRMGIRRHT